MQTFSIVIDNETGNASQLIGHGPMLLTGPSTIRRASHIEPCSRPLRLLFHALRSVCPRESRLAGFTRKWPCVWRVNLTPVNGPILPDTFNSRSQAIECEVSWLESNWKHLK